jgi:hypothetical protein
MSLDQQHCTPFAESSDTIAWLQLLRQPGSDCQQHVVFEPDVLDSEDVPEPFVAQVSDCHLLSLGPDCQVPRWRCLSTFLWCLYHMTWKYIIENICLFWVNMKYIPHWEGRKYVLLYVCAFAAIKILCCGSPCSAIWLKYSIFPSSRSWVEIVFLF